MTTIATDTPTPATSPVAVATTEAQQMVDELQERLEDIYTRVNPSVVNIQVARKQTLDSSQDFTLPEQDQNPLPDEFFSQGSGSGFVWDTNGHIVTNSHVVNGMDRMTITFHDGTIVDAKLVGEDPDSDLAVLKVDIPAERLLPMEIADSTQVQVGQLAIAIGNPFGLAGTMTIGFISALGRSLPVFAQELDAYYAIPDVIQSDNSINPGNSGGVLVNDQGQLIGVTSAIQSPVRASVGIGFSIPSAIVSQVVPVLIEKGTYEHPWLGVSGVSLTPDIALEMELDENQHGALVVEAIKGSPSHKAGIRGSNRQISLEGRKLQVGGDVIIAFDGKPVVGFDDLPAYLARSASVGQTVKLTVLRDGTEQTLDVKLDARPSSEQTSQQATNDDSNVGESGIEGRTLIPAIADAMNLSPDQKGVLVIQIVQDSPADVAGIRGSYKSMSFNGETIQIGGDVITAIDGEIVETVEAFETFIANAAPGQRVTLTILRDGEEVDVELTLA